MALTDVGNVEDELVHSDIDDVQQEITTSSRFLSLHNPPKADASGLPEWLSEAMQLLGPEHCSRCRHKPVLIGIGTVALKTLLNQ